MHSSASLEAESFSGSGLQMSTCTDIYKVRKPYTLTKQRERWTKEEHNKFLEALKLYGRAWRQIKEHIGTKTAVQIRSHAQKFFSKVIRDSTLKSVGGTAIEIPPPRPKRKPVHPYPRKLGSLSTKASLNMPRQERSVSPPVVSDQDNGSPTSVLSGIGSSWCASPFAAGGEKPNEKRNYQSESPDEDGTRLVLQGPTSMVNGNEDHLIEVEAASHVLKLFGRDVLVTNSRKPSVLSVGVSNCDGKLVPAANAIYQADHDGEPTDQVVDYLGVSGDGVWNLWRGGNLPAVAPVVPVPRWLFYFSPSIQPQNAAQCCMEAEDESRQRKERSWTGSKTSSVSEVGPADGISEVFESRSTAFSLKLIEKADANRPRKGFIPYREFI